MNKIIYLTVIYLILNSNRISAQTCSNVFLKNISYGEKMTVVNFSDVQEYRTHIGYELYSMAFKANQEIKSITEIGPGSALSAQRFFLKKHFNFSTFSFIEPNINQNSYLLEIFKASKIINSNLEKSESNQKHIFSLQLFLNILTTS